MKNILLLLFLILQFSFISPAIAQTASTEKSSARSLLGEKLTYNVSFLWFKKIARGEIRFEAGEKEGTYLATLVARTRGMAAFFTRNRVETYSTLMEEGPGGFLRPLLQISDTKKGSGDDISHRQTSYAFNFITKQVTYNKIDNGKVGQKKIMPMVEGVPTYDFLTAFYNLRLGRLGTIDPGKEIVLSAFSRKGPETISINRLSSDEQSRMEISNDLMMCKVLMSPETFKSKGRDLFVGFDSQLRPKIAIVKKVIGLGDVLGELVHVVAPTQIH